MPMGLLFRKPNFKCADEGNFKHDSANLHQAFLYIDIHISMMKQIKIIRLYPLIKLHLLWAVHPTGCHEICFSTGCGFIETPDCQAPAIRLDQVCQMAAHN